MSAPLDTLRGIPVAPALALPDERGMLQAKWILFVSDGEGDDAIAEPVGGPRDYGPARRMRDAIRRRGGIAFLVRVVEVRP